MIEEHFKCAETGFDSETDRTSDYHQTPQIIELIKQKVNEYSYTYLDNDEIIDKDLVDEGLYITQGMLNDIKQYVLQSSNSKDD